MLSYCRAALRYRIWGENQRAVAAAASANFGNFS
jgi:hypothetical protein